MEIKASSCNAFRAELFTTSLISEDMNPSVDWRHWGGAPKLFIQYKAKSSLDIRFPDER